MSGFLFSESYYKYLILAIVVGVLLACQNLYQRWVRRKLYLSYNCQDTTHYPQKDIWGSDLTKIRMEKRDEGRYWKWTIGQFELYGRTWDENVAGKRKINTTDVKNIQTLLANDSSAYIKPRNDKFSIGRFLGMNSILMSDGTKWKHSRALVKPIFAKAELSNVSQLDRFVEQFLQTLPPAGETFDIMPLLHALTLDVSTDLIFGKPLGAMTTNKEEADTFQRNFHNAMMMAGTRHDKGWGRLFSYWDKDFAQACAKVHDAIDVHVYRALRETDPQNMKKDTSSDGRYVVVNEMARVVRDPIVLRHELMGIFAPARESVSVFVGHCLFQLARHPSEWDRLRKTALTVEKPWTMEKLKALTEIRYALQETVRTIGPAGIVDREAIKDTILPRGGGPDQESPIFVLKGTIVSANVFSALHDKETWGKDAEEFRPSRWQDKKISWEFIPFSGGVRQCPAMQMSYMHATYVLVALMQKYEHIENKDPVEEWLEQWHFLFESKNGVKIALFNGNRN